jgi:hypothetical protein
MNNCVLIIVFSFTVNFGPSLFPTVHDRLVVLLNCLDKIFTLILYFFLPLGVSIVLINGCDGSISFYGDPVRSM